MLKIRQHVETSILEAVSVNQDVKEQGLKVTLFAEAGMFNALDAIVLLCSRSYSLPSTTL